MSIKKRSIYKNVGHLSVYRNLRLTDIEKKNNTFFLDEISNKQEWIRPDSILFALSTPSCMSHKNANYWYCQFLYLNKVIIIFSTSGTFPQLVEVKNNVANL